MPPEILNEDLRTATFILRPDSSQDGFRFSHTSLQEYFLACYLLRALEKNESEKWALPMPSPETFGFLGQMLSLTQPQKHLKTLEQMLEHHHSDSTRNAFRLWLLCIEKDLPVPSPKNVDLHGENFEQWNICGKNPQQPLNQMGANLSKCNLMRSTFKNVQLSSSDLNETHLNQAEFHHTNLANAKIEQAVFSGTLFRHCQGGNWSGQASWHGSSWIYSNIDITKTDRNFRTQATQSLCDSHPPPLSRTA